MTFCRAAASDHLTAAVKLAEDTEIKIEGAFRRCRAGEAGTAAAIAQSQKLRSHADRASAVRSDLEQYGAA